MYFFANVCWQAFLPSFNKYLASCVANTHQIERIGDTQIFQLDECGYFRANCSSEIFLAEIPRFDWQHERGTHGHHSLQGRVGTGYRIKKWSLTRKLPTQHDCRRTSFRWCQRKTQALEELHPRFRQTLCNVLMACRCQPLDTGT